MKYMVWFTNTSFLVLMVLYFESDLKKLNLSYLVCFTKVHSYY